MLTFGSGQTSGQPLVVTATTLGGAQVLHTFIAGTGTAEIVEAFVLNSDTVQHTLNFALYNVSAALVREWSVLVPVGASLAQIFDSGALSAALVANGTTVLKVYADTTTVVAVSARVDTQVATTNTTTFGSGQTSGQPLALTALTLGTAQTVHTFPAGSANPQVLQAFAFNSDADEGLTVHLAIYNSGATLVREWAVVVPAATALFPLFSNGEDHAILACNGTTVLKAYVDRTGLAIACRVVTQV